jgi:hypothetical protein
VGGEGVGDSEGGRSSTQATNQGSIEQRVNSMPHA